MKKEFIADLKKSQIVDSVFMLRRKTLRFTKQDKPYLSMGFADKSGEVEARVWNDAENVNKKVQVGDIIRVKGAVEEYRGTRQLKVGGITKAEEGTYEFEDLVRVLKNRKKILEEVKGKLRSLENLWIKDLVERFLGDKDLMSRLECGVGAKRWHNAYIGGLVEHTLEVMTIAEHMCLLYPEANRDVTLLGAFMHDLGKVYELDHSKMEYTIEGGLVGHIAIGVKLLFKKTSEIKDFPADLSMRLEHIILSHHGEYEQQSPVLPKTLESTIVYHTDDLVSQANAIKEILNTQKKEGKLWSDFVGIKNRKYFIRSQDAENWKNISSNGKKVPGREDQKDLFT